MSEPIAHARPDTPTKPNRPASHTRALGCAILTLAGSVMFGAGTIAVSQSPGGPSDGSAGLVFGGLLVVAGTAGFVVEYVRSLRS